MQSDHFAFLLSAKTGALLFLFVECKARALLCEIGFVAGKRLFHRRYAGRLSLAPVGRNDAPHHVDHPL